MKKKFLIAIIFLSLDFLYAETVTPIYKLYIKSTDRAERIAVSADLEKIFRVKPHCAHCVDCDDYMECKGCALMGCGWGSNYETVYTTGAAGLIYRGKYNSSGKLVKVEKIDFQNLFDNCIETGTYEYVAYDDFPFEQCSNLDNPSECGNYAKITVGYHEISCLSYPEVKMTRREFDSMKYMYEMDDSEYDEEEPDLETVSDDDPDMNENDLFVDDEESSDNYKEENIPDNVVSEVDNSSIEDESNKNPEKDPFYNQENTSSVGCSVLIL